MMSRLTNFTYRDAGQTTLEVVSSIVERLNRLEIEKVLLQQEVAALKAKQEALRLPLPTFNIAFAKRLDSDTK